MSVLGEKKPHKRQRWSADEDARPEHLIAKHGSNSWTTIALRLQGRDRQQYQEQWRRHLQPHKKGMRTPEEDQEILDCVEEMGAKWAQISRQYMLSRTDMDIKQRWNLILRRACAP